MGPMKKLPFTSITSIFHDEISFKGFKKHLKYLEIWRFPHQPGSWIRWAPRNRLWAASKLARASCRLPAWRIDEEWLDLKSYKDILKISIYTYIYMFMIVYVHDCISIRLQLYFFSKIEKEKNFVFGVTSHQKPYIYICGCFCPTSFWGVSYELMLNI